MDDYRCRCNYDRQLLKKGGANMMTKQKAVYEKCSECGHPQSKWLVNDVAYCADCYADRFCTCRNCDGIEYIDKATSFNGMDYCRNCADELFFTCAECGDTTLSDTMHAVDDECYCQSCYDELFFYCGSCDNEYRRTDGYMHNSRLYCSDCYHDIFSVCDECGQTVYSEDIYYNDDEDRYLCQNCSESESGTIRYNSYMPALNFQKMQYENTLYMGLELEVECGTHNSRTIAKDFTDYLDSKKNGNKFYMKQDGSLGNGFEVVSHPFTLQYAHKHLQFKDMLKKLRNLGCHSYTGGSCGIHIHVNKDFFTPKEIRKMRLFFCVNSEYLYRFSCRGNTGRNFCMKEEYYMADMRDRKVQIGRYWMLNLNTLKGTIELRLFRGTLSYKRFLAILQFTDAICNFAKVASFQTMAKYNSWHNFIDWTRHNNRHRHFIKHTEGRMAELCV